MRTPLWDQAIRDVRRVTAVGRRSLCEAYQFWDGFDHYNASSQVWSGVYALTPTYSSSFARFPAPAGCLGQGVKNPALIQNLLSNQQTLIFGFAAFFPQFGSEAGLLALLDAGTFQCQLNVMLNGSLHFHNSNGTGTLIASSSPGIITTGVWHWFDIEIVISATVGSIAVYIDQPAGGAAAFTATGLNTQHSSNAYANQFYWGDLNGLFNGMLGDDFHCHDITGSAPNAILGDSRIYTKKASGAGYSTLWTPNGAAANWQCVDDTLPDGDTTYVSSNTAGQIDGYAIVAAGFTSVPNGVVRRSYLRRDDAGPHTFQNGIRSGTSNALGTAFTVPSSYAWTDCGTCYVNDPATSSPFTAASADAAQLIIDETS